MGNKVVYHSTIIILIFFVNKNLILERAMDLIRASRNGDVSTITRLLSEGVDINFKNTVGHTSLMFASRYSNDKKSYLNPCGTL